MKKKKKLEVLCTHCKSNNFIKKGQRDGFKIFKCKNCGKQFRYKLEDLIGTEYEVIQENIKEEEIIESKIKVNKKIKIKNNVLNSKTLETYFMANPLNRSSDKYTLLINNEPCRVTKLNLRSIVANNTKFSIIINKANILELITKEI